MFLCILFIIHPHSVNLFLILFFAGFTLAVSFVVFGYIHADGRSKGPLLDVAIHADAILDVVLLT
jgi:hypothetical protein